MRSDILSNTSKTIFYWVLCMKFTTIFYNNRLTQVYSNDIIIEPSKTETKLNASVLELADRHVWGACVFSYGFKSRHSHHNSYGNWYNRVSCRNVFLCPEKPWKQGFLQCRCTHDRRQTTIWCIFYGRYFSCTARYTIQFVFWLGYRFLSSCLVMAGVAPSFEMMVAVRWKP